MARRKPAQTPPQEGAATLQKLLADIIPIIVSPGEAGIAEWLMDGATLEWI